jgi:hypothetical protein
LVEREEVRVEWNRVTNERTTYRTFSGKFSALILVLVLPEADKRGFGISEK